MSLLDVAGLTIDIPLSNGVLHAVRDVDLKVERGQTLCIVGESGCGKSLTSLSVMGLLPSKARIRADRIMFDGTDLLGLSDKALAPLRGNRIAMIFQDPMTSLNPSFSIGDQLSEVLLTHRKVSRREARARAEFLLGKVGIPSPGERLHQYPHQLSGGLRQRVMIALALMCEPALIIADEPTTALDVTVQAQILNLLKSLQKEFGMALMLVTHDLGIVARVADMVAVMYAGQVVEYGSTAELFANPRHPYTRGLLDCIPVPGRTDRNHPLGTIAGMVPSLIGPQRGCSFSDRCPKAQETCTVSDVALNVENGSHSFRCLFPLDSSRSLLKEAAL